MSTDRYEQALATVTQQLKDEFGDRLIGLLLSGSYAYGEPMATSDVDLYVVIDEPWRQRRNLVVDGVDVELFINPPEKLSSEIVEAGSTMEMFARGRIIHDPRGTVATLVGEAKTVADMPRPIPLGDELERLRYMATDTVKDAYDLLEADDEGLELAMHNALDWTLDAYYKLAGRRRPKPKYVMRDLRSREPALADAARRIIDSAAPPRERWELLDALSKEVLEHVGGPLVESATTPQRVVLEPVVAHIEGVELPPEDIVVRPPRRFSIAVRAAYSIAGIGLFVIALGLMKSGATALAPTLEGSVFTDNAWSTLGLGWLGACIVLSGSPIAASALAFLDGGTIDRVQSFTMLTGSRLGAAFVVLVVGTAYALRRRAGSGRRAPISIGILSLLMTMTLYVPAAIAGYFLLDRGVLDGLNIGTSPSVTSVTDALFGWAVDAARAVMPGWTLFPLGLIVLIAGFALIDRVMPSLGGEQMEHRPDAWYERKWPMFLLGCGVCMLTLSVSVALTVLVPLVAKGYVRRANTLPYIAGANITTLADTLVAAILLGNQDAVRVVVAVTVTVAVLTVIVLAVAYPLLRRVCLGFAGRVLVSPARLAAFVAVLFAVPLTLIAL
ncbi:MAG TPA: nucleotidyltransferase domain-containing protein [Actinomycetota bacterium]|nr:nucleotidyltransferase domain-containing protein [Actinomycetota bacterium]